MVPARPVWNPQPVPGEHDAREPRRINVGAVAYLNARPLTLCLDEFVPAARIVVDIPSRLADGVAAGDLEPAPLFVDDTALLTITQLRAKARRLAANHGIQAVLVDYLQLMTYSGRAPSRQEQISEISRGIKALARELDVPVITAAQLNRGPADRPTHRPRMSDLRESGSIEQDADVVMLLHNEDYYHKGEDGYMPKHTTELIIEKQRNGPTGVVQLHFRPSITRFEVAAPDHVAAQAASF